MIHSLYHHSLEDQDSLQYPIQMNLGGKYNHDFWTIPILTSTIALSLVPPGRLMESFMSGNILLIPSIIEFRWTGGAVCQVLMF